MTLATTRWRALKLGCVFGRSSQFELPRVLRLNGRRIKTNFPDQEGVRVAFLELLLSDCYELRGVHGQVSRVLDIGANVGIFALAARLRFPQAEIHCYEPNCELAPFLEVQANAANAKCFWEAVAKEDGHVSLDVRGDSVNTTSRTDSSGQIPAVAFRTAVDRLKNNVDVAKVDCEGAEWDFLQDHEPWQNVRYLAMEYHLQQPGQTHERAIDLVSRRGFTIRKQIRADGFGLIAASRG